MIIEALIGGLIGPLFRLAPEVLKFFDKKNERAHELAMQAANLEADKARYANQLAVSHIQAESANFTAGVSALQEALRGQFQVTGNKWIDALNFSVRPVITYAFFILYSLVKISLLMQGLSIIQIWTEADMGLFSGILSFYFMGRVFDRK